MAHVIQVGSQYIGPRGRLTDSLDGARIYKRRCDATNSMRHGVARWQTRESNGALIVEVTLKVKTPRKPRAKVKTATDVVIANEVLDERFPYEGY